MTNQIKSRSSGKTATLKENLASKSSDDDIEINEDKEFRLRTERTVSFIEQLKGAPPENMQKIVDSVIQMSHATDPSLIIAHAEVKRRHSGMWVGAGMTIVSVTGGVALLLSSAPAAIGIGLLSFGTVCAGATFAIITGKTVSLNDFSKALVAARNVIGGHSKKRKR